MLSETFRQVADRLRSGPSLICDVRDQSVATYHLPSLRTSMIAFIVMAIVPDPF